MSKIDKITDEDVKKMEAHIRNLTSELKEQVEMHTDMEARNGGLTRENHQLRQIVLANSGAIQKVGLSLVKMGIQMGIPNEKAKDGQK